MSGGGGSSKSTTNTIAQPPSYVVPSLQRGIASADQLFASGGFRVDPYQGQRVAGFGDTTQAAQGMIMNQAMQPQASQQAQGALSAFMGGDPYARLDEVKREALGSAVPAAASMFSASGGLDSSAAMDTVGRAAAQAVAPIQFQAFNDMNQNMLRAAALAPGADAAAYMPAQMMGQVGAQQDAMSQAQIDANMARFYEGQQAPIDELQRYSQLLLGYGGMGGQTSSTGTQPGASTAGRVIGGGLSGAAAGSMLGPWGAVGGGLLGVLGGLF